MTTGAKQANKCLGYITQLTFEFTHDFQ